MEFDLARLPFSRRGSRLAIGSEEGRLVLRDVGGGDEIAPVVFDMDIAGSGENAADTRPAEEFSAAASPSECLLSPKEGGRVSIHFENASTLVFECSGGTVLRFSMRKGRYDHIGQLGPGIWEVQSYLKDRKYRFEFGPETLARVDAPWDGVGNKSIGIEFSAGCLRLSEYAVCPGEGRPADSGALTAAEQADAARSFEAWQAGLPAVGPSLASARELAAYITWSCMVAPEGRLTREGMYMSKNWMLNVWSWDNCFNGLGLASRFPQSALDQLGLIADNQHASGAYPDYVNDKFASYSCLKPPIHAWALNRMLERAGWTGACAAAPASYAGAAAGSADAALQSRIRAEASSLYASISRSTAFWLDTMRLPSGALIYKHGNDSGWDNASVFASGGPVESPDLYAHLCRQCDELALLARRLGRPGAEAAAWESRAAALAEQMIERCWDGRGFFARRGPDGEKIAERGSLILRLPLRAGRRLPPDARAAIVAELGDEGRFLAAAGLATEALDSPRYRSDGYWLGPVWAPTTYLFVDALRDCGETELARGIALRFVRTCARSGMAENFDARTAQGLCDPAFTWTSSVFLLLLEEYPELRMI